MAVKYDGVVEAVRYAPDGQIQLARVYERRGAAFTDRILLTRQQMVDRLKAGKKFQIGQRKAHLGGIFEVSAPVRLAGEGEAAVITSDEHAADHDELKGAPVF